jgi:DNA replication protein DnaC
VKRRRDDQPAGPRDRGPRITTASALNLPFKQWDTIFPNASCAVALIDRLTHHAEIVAIDGDSYRLRDAERAQKARRPKKAE